MWKSLLLLACAGMAFAQRNPFGNNPDAIEAGRQTYLGACSACHGASGQGGTGPNLITGRNTARIPEGQLFRSIRDGLPGTDMPPFKLPDEKVWQLVSFVKSLSAPAIAARVPGDPVAGRAVFFGKGGCSNCHRVAGQGGHLGPDLSNAGINRTLLQMRESLFDPNNRIEKGFEGVTVTTVSGAVVEGVAKNENNYSIQVLDKSGRLHLLSRSTIKEIRRRDGSLMPAGYDRKLSKEESDSVIAFLSRQSIRETSVSYKGSAEAGVTFEDIKQGPGKNWLTYNGDYRAQRHSPLKQINTANAGNLVTKWTYFFDGAKRLEAVPLVYDGVMYVTNTNEMRALDARSGREIWRYGSPKATGTRVNRGSAILGDKVFFITADTHLVALHRATGAVLWEREFASAEKGYSSSLAPLALKNYVLVGVAGGGSGQRGFVAALSADDGHEMWRFWTVPAKGEKGSETWGNFPTEWGGAPTWTTGTYDPESNTIYWPTGNPWPDFFGGARPGDNLYSDCLLALDAETGKLKWHFQFVPHDVWDWDANETPVILDSTWKGQPRKLVVQANRNGYYYILDRTTGEFLHAQPFVKRLDWAKGLDAKGRPILVPGKVPTPAGVKICPSVRGATNFFSPSYNPSTGMLYVVTLEKCDIYIASAKEARPSTGFRGTGSEGIPAEPGEFYLRALEANSGEIKWSYRMPGPSTMWAGTVSTAGGVVFSGDDDGNLVALDAKTGKDLWHFGTGQTLYASPITYELDGKQYVTIASETNVYTFGLFDGAASGGAK